MVQTSKRTGLQAMLQPGIHYDDLFICNSQGVYKNGMSLLDQILEQMNNHYAGTQNSVYLHDIKLYPNPANTNLTVSYNLLENETATLKLYNIIGNEVREVKLHWKNNKVSFGVSDLVTGVYIYKYEISGRVVSTGKLVIE